VNGHPDTPQADFNRWYDEEYLAERTGIPGFLTGRQFGASQSPPKYVALYDTVDAQVLWTNPYLTVLNNASAWTQCIRSDFQSFVRDEHELILTLGTIPEKASPYVLLVRMGMSQEHQAEFNDWYNTDHVPALTSVPRGYGARRYRATVGSATYLAMYELAHADVRTREAWRTSAASPWTLPMRRLYRDFAATFGQVIKALP
jgi:hypothetical protein